MAVNIMSNIGKPQKTINEYERLRTGILSRAQKAIGHFETAGIWKTYQDYRKKTLTGATKLMAAYKTSRLHNRYDILRIGGFVATEAALSNVIASLLDPNRPHQLGKTPLQNLLTTLKHRNPPVISSILEILDQSDIRIRVTRELRLETSIPDIAIESSNFIIFIENKLRGKVETGDGTQTLRQWDDLIERGKRYGISNLLGIFLTPEGKAPSSSAFVPLSVHELVSAIQKALEDTKDCSSEDMIDAFLQFYDWHDC